MIYLFGDFELDEHLYELRLMGHALKVEPKVFEVLVYLIHHRERFVSRDELIENLWPGVVVGEAALTQCVAKARKAVGDNSEKQQVIKTQHGRGYRFVMDVAEHEKNQSTSVPSLSAEFSEQNVSPVQQNQSWVALQQVTESNAAAAERSNVPLQLAPHWAWLRVRLALVGMLLCLGCVAAIGHLLFRGFSPREGAPVHRNATHSALYDLERKPRPVWLLSSDSPEAAAYGVRGWEEYYRFTPEANARARRLFEEAIRRDPRYAAAYVGMGWTYVAEWSAFWTEDSHSLEHAVTFAHQALTQEASFPPAHALLGYAYLLRRQYDEAVAAGERAVALGPTCAECYATLAEIFTCTGRPLQAIELTEYARLLDPTSTAYYAAIAGWAYYLMGQPDLAVWALRRAVIRNPNVWLRRLHLALAYREIGLAGRARAEIREGLKLNSHLSLVALRERLPHQNPGKVENLLAALRQVGLQ